MDPGFELQKNTAVAKGVPEAFFQTQATTGFDDRDHNFLEYIRKNRFSPVAVDPRPGLLKKEVMDDISNSYALLAHNSTLATTPGEYREASIALGGLHAVGLNTLRNPDYLNRLYEEMSALGITENSIGNDSKKAAFLAHAGLTGPSVGTISKDMKLMSLPKGELSVLPKEAQRVVGKLGNEIKSWNKPMQMNGRRSTLTGPPVSNQKLKNPQKIKLRFPRL